MATIHVNTQGLHIDLDVEAQHLRDVVHAVVKIMEQLDLLNAYAASGAMAYENRVEGKD